jgi:hypothetical protein
MWSEYSDKLENNKIVSVYIEDSKYVTNFTIAFESGLLDFEAFNAGYYNGKSWFEFPNNLDEMVGKTLIDLYKDDQEFESVTKKYHHHGEEQITFITDDGTQYVVNFRHYSNGYYSGTFAVEYKEMS